MRAASLSETKILRYRQKEGYLKCAPMLQTSGLSNLGKGKAIPVTGHEGP
jgi:hypothetical protein